MARPIVETIPAISAGSSAASWRIEACRTAALGGHVERCDDCGMIRIAYNSCRNRHCPKCQGAARADWLAARQAELLPVPYFHVVFTLPPAAAGSPSKQGRRSTAILFQAAAETLRRSPRTPASRRQVGLIAVLHTWGQTLHYHPHVHCVVPGGGFARRHALGRLPAGLLLPVRVLSRLFRGMFLGACKPPSPRGELHFFGELAALARAAAFGAALRALRHRIGWSTPSRPSAVPSRSSPISAATPIGSQSPTPPPRGRGRQVAFRCGLRHDGKTQVMLLAAAEFIRRFLLHGLPAGFHRIRHYGFLANRQRGESLAPLPRHLLHVASKPRSGRARTRRATTTGSRRRS